MSTVKKIGVGVIGCGYWGPNLVRNFLALPDCQLKTICDVSQERLRHLKSVYPSVETETNYEQMLKDPALHAVVIATSVRHHFPMAKNSLLAGKHTLIEKPLAASVEQCEELIALAKKQGLVLMVGHTFLYSPAVRKIKEILDKKDIGVIQYISARRLNLGLFQKDINVAWDLAPHDISIILYLMGEFPYSVNCRGAAHITPGIEDVTSMSLHFSQDKTAMIQSSWLDPKKVREMTIVGSERMIVYDDLPAQEKIKIYDVSVKAPRHYDTFAEFHYAYHYGDIYSPYIKQEEPLKSECQHFLDCIRNGRTPLTSGTKGLDVVRILEASSASIKLNGAPIDLPKAGQPTRPNSRPPIPFAGGSNPPMRSSTANPFSETKSQKSGGASGSAGA
ncbi:MAG: Gfo/Idh/MocA family oxidoreductase [Opitutaceae bacterium]|nr:Gfo/Idh/MocA family oxidoreductase [Opitutaceae bacterium]